MDKNAKIAVAVIVGGIGVVVLALLLGRTPLAPPPTPGQIAAREAAEAPKRRAADENAARKEAVPFVTLVQQAAEGKNTSFALASVIAAREFEGFVVENAAPTLVAAETGKGVFDGRSLQGAIIEVTITVVNREAGKRHQVCLVQTALHDEDFQMWRNMTTTSCDSTVPLDQIDGWRKSVSFVSEHRLPFDPAPFPSLPPRALPAPSDTPPGAAAPGASASSAAGPDGSVKLTRSAALKDCKTRCSAPGADLELCTESCMLSHDF